MKRIILAGIFLFVLCASLTLNAQWARTYGGSDFDRAFFIQQTSDGGYIAAGSIYYPARTPDFLLIKTNETGNSQWNLTFGGSGREECKCMKQTSNGGYILAGTTTSFGAGGGDFWLIKTGPDTLGIQK